MNPLVNFLNSVATQPAPGKKVIRKATEVRLLGSRVALVEDPDRPEATWLHRTLLDLANAVHGRFVKEDRDHRGVFLVLDIPPAGGST